MVLGEFACATSLDDVYPLQLTDGRVRINNFTLSEDKSWSAKDLMVLNLSASGSNRTDKPIHLSIEAVGYDWNNGVLFAVTAQPLFSMIGGDKTETIKGDIYVAPNIITNASKICLRVTGDF
jgi:hypothetical protein